MVLLFVSLFRIVLLGFLLVCPFMLSIVSKMVNVSTFMSTTLNQTEPKKQKKKNILLHYLQLACLEAPSPTGTCIAR